MYVILGLKKPGAIDNVWYIFLTVTFLPCGNGLDQRSEWDLGKSGWVPAKDWWDLGKQWCGSEPTLFGFGSRSDLNLSNFLKNKALTVVKMIFC